MVSLCDYGTKSHAYDFVIKDLYVIKKGHYLCQTLYNEYNLIHSSWICYFFKDFIYLFLERGEGRENEREKH